MNHLIFALFTASLFASSALAQKPERDVDTIIADSRIKTMTTALALTDEQKDKVRPLILEEIKKFKAIRQDASLTEEQRIEQEKEFRVANKPKFKAILSDEQMTRYEQMQSGKRGARKKVEEKKEESK